MSFDSEKEMSQSFAQILRKRLHEGIDIIPEMDGVVGIPDYVLVKRDDRQIIYVVTIELKLRNWQRGLVQAFRAKTFSNECYVVLDSNYIQPALANIEEFQRSGVGLASLSSDKVLTIHREAQPDLPTSYTLSNILISKIETYQRKELRQSPNSHKFSESLLGRNYFSAFETVDGNAQFIARI